MKFLMLFLFSFSAMASDYLMPRETLKSDLNVYSCAASSCSKVAKVAKETPLKKVSRSGSWYEVTFDGKRGYVYRNSVTNYEIDLGYFRNLLAEEIEVYRQNGMVCIVTGGYGYYLNPEEAEDLPEGKRNHKNIRELLSERGGFEKVTEDNDPCGFL